MGHHLARRLVSTALAFHDLSLGYRHIRAVDGLRTEIAEGSLTAVVGPNGAGKSTLFKGVTGTISPLTGSVTFGSGGRTDVAYLPQQSAIERDFPLSVREIVAMGLWREIGPFGRITRAMWPRLAEAISVLALDDAALILLCSIASLSLITLALLFRPVVLECADPEFLRSVSRLSAVKHFGFLALVVLNLVGGFHALGTLMAVGIMILPAAAARFWVERIGSLISVAVVIATLSSLCGLLLSYHVDLPTGPAIILVAGIAYAVSLSVGPAGGLLSQTLARRPLTH